jgi:hypothetical protein
MTTQYPTKDQVEETRSLLKEMNDAADRVIDKTAEQSTPMTPQQK